MKTQSTLRALLLGASFLVAPYVQGATYYWDIDGATAGSGGVTPSDTWSTGGTTWTTDSTGTTATSALTTTSLDNLFFSAGTDATGAYAVSLNSTTQNARLVTFEDGTATLNTGTLSLGNGGGITVTSNSVTGATISSGLTLSGSQTFNVAAGRTLTLNTGTFTRNAGSTLNILSTGTVTTTMTNLSTASLVNGIIGSWASFGSGASTKYATIDGSNNIVGLTGTAAATAANVTSTLGTFNYDVAAVGTLGAGANINTLRYTGAAGTIAGALTTNGIMNVGGNALTFSSLISSGTGGIVLNAANGNLIFPHTTGGLSIGSNPLTITGSSAVTFGTINQNNITLTGSGNLVKNGSGVFGLGGLNTGFTGSITVADGTLLVTALGSIGSGNLTLNGGIYEEYWGNTFARALGSGAGQVQLTGGASGFSENGSTGMTVNLGGAAATVVWGSSFFNPSTLVLQSAAAQTGSTLAFSNGINLNGATRTIASYKTSSLASGATIAGVISNSTGNAGLIKTGEGLLILSNTNTYNDSTTISAGILQANSTAALGNSSATNTLIFNGGTLRAGAAFNSAATRGVTMTSTGIIDTNAFAVSFLGNITGAGGLTKNSTGTLTLSGTNTYGGLTTVNAGTLAINKQVSLYNNTPASWTAANLNIKSGAALQLNVDSAGTAGFTAASLDTLLGNILVANTAAQGLQAGAILGFDTSTATGATFTQGSAISNSTGAFGGQIGLTKLGAGTLVLDQTNAYSGATTITAGTLDANSSAALGNSSFSNTLILNGGTLKAGGTISSGAARGVNLTAASTIDTNSNNISIAGNIFGSFGLTKSGLGNLTLSNVNTNTGTTTVSAGTLTLSNNLALQTSALVTTGAGTITLSGVTTPTFGGLSGASGNLATIISNYNTVTDLTLNPQSGSLTYGGIISNSDGAVTLTKTGAGIQILTSTNTYTGTTFLNGGTLTLSSATGKITGTTAIQFNGGTLLFSGPGSNSDINAINDAATITVNNSSTFSVTAGAAGGASNNETVGAVTLNAGQMNFNWTNGGSSGSLMTLTSLARSGTASANFNSGFSINSSRWKVTGAGTTTGGQIIGPWYTTGANAVNTASTDYAVYSSDFIAQANIGGSAETTWTTAANAYTTSAGATVTLTGTRTITALRNTGATTVLTLASGANLETYGLLNGAATLLTVAPGTGGALTTPTGGGNLYLNAGAAAITVSAPINNNGGAVTLVKNGPNTVTLSGTNNFSGNVIINDGTLTFSNIASWGGASKNVTFAGNGTLISSVATYSGGIIDTGISSNTATIQGTSSTFASAAGAGTLLYRGQVMNSILNIGDASALTGNLRIDTGGTTNAHPVVQFSRLSDTVGSKIQFGGTNGDSNQQANAKFVGTAPLVFNNRVIEILRPPSSNGPRYTKVFNDSTSAANTWTINTNLSMLSTASRELELTGTNTGDNAFNGLIGNGSGTISLTKTGTGKWIVSNNNTFTGVTSLSAGTLELTKLANGGLTSSLGVSSNAAGNLILNGGTLRYSGAAASTDRLFSLSASSSLDASGTGAVNFTNTGAMGFNGGGAAKTLTLTGTNTGDNTLAAAIGDLTLATSLTKTGIGTWVLSGANTNTGATTVSGGGTLVLDYSTQDDSKIAGVLTLSNGGGGITLRGGSHLDAVTSLSIAAGGGHTAITRDGGTAKLSLGAFTRTGNGGVTMSFAEDALATTTSAVVNGILGGGITVGSNWAKVSSGNIVALTSGDYTALTAAGTTSTVNYQLTGTLSRAAASLKSLRIVGDGDNQVLTITSGDLSPSPLSDASATPGRYSGNSAAGGILYAGGGNNNYTITGSGNIKAQNSNQELIIHAHTGTLTVDMALNMGTSILTKSGAGTLVLTKAGTYTSGTMVNQGALRMQHATATGSGGHTVANNAALELANSVAVGNRALSITGAGVSSGGALRNVASNTSSYAGAITIGTGGARINSDSSGALTLSGGVVTSLHNNVTFGGAGNTTVSTAVISGGGGLVKDGAGVTTLTAINTYTGATTVSNGILAVNGSGTINSSAVTINGGNFRYNSTTAYSGALTMTSGTISGTNWNGSLGNQTIATGDVVSPGNSPGTAITTAQTWAAGGSYEWEINSTTAGIITPGNAGADPGWDLINGSGTLNITATVGNEFTIDVMSLTLANVAGAVHNFDNSTSDSWMIADFNAINGFSADAFIIDTTQFALHNAFTGTFDIALGNSGSIGGTDSEIWLTYTVIPEPKTALLGCLGVLLILRRRR